MRVTNIFGNSGPEYQNTERPFDIQSFVEMPRAARRLELCKSFYDFCVQIGSGACAISDHISAREAGHDAPQRIFAVNGSGLDADVGEIARAISPIRPGLVVICRSLTGLADLVIALMFTWGFRDNDLRTTLCRSQTGLCNDLASFLSGAAASGFPMVSAIRRVPGGASFS